MSVTKEAVIEKLRTIPGPDGGGDIVSMGLVSDIFIADGKAFFSITVPAARARELEPLRETAERAVKSIPGIVGAMVALTAEKKGGGMERAPAPPPRAGAHSHGHAHGHSHAPRPAPEPAPASRQPGKRGSLAEWAVQVGASERALARLFRDELGTSYQQWRQQAVLAHALPLLARGVPVSHVAAASGYASDSAFTAMFKSAMGQPPSHFYRRAR